MGTTVILAPQGCDLLQDNPQDRKRIKRVQIGWAQDDGGEMYPFLLRKDGTKERLTTETCRVVYRVS